MFKKSLLLILLMALIAPWAAKGQNLSDYTLTVGSETYTSIATTENRLASVSGDDGTQTVQLPFEFNFGETTYASGTNITVRADGYIYFPTSSSGHYAYNAWTSTSWIAIVPFLNYDGDITSSGDTSGAFCTTDDPDNPTMLIIEFKGLKKYNTSTSYNFQVRLHSNGNISTIYGTSTISGSYHNFFLANKSDKICLTGSYAEPGVGTPSTLPQFSTAPVAGQVITYVRPVYTCFKPQNLHATLTPGDGTIATLTWERNAQGTEDAWVLEYGTAANFEGATSVNVTGGTPSKDLTSLTAEQKYYARVKPDCDTDGSKWSDAISFTPTDAYSITVYANGTDSETSTVIPMYGNYFDDYTKSECIIPATELGTMQWGQITSITFYAKTIGTNSSTWTSTNQKVFLKEVNSTTLGGSYSGMDGATIVFDGLLPMPTTSTDGYTITFSQSYTYSGGNLLIGVYNDDDGTYNSVTWYGKTGLTSGVSAYGSNGSSLASVGYTEQSFLPKTTFNYIPGSAPSCLPPTNLAATEDQPNESELSWTANNGETSWNIYYKKASAATYTEIADVTDNPYTLPNLDPATQYQFYVVANCTETSDPSAVFPFTTACGIISTYPWNENFDSYAGSTSGTTNNLPLCWNYINTSDGDYDTYKGYPIVYNSSSYSYSGNNHLRFYSYYSSWYDYDPQPEYAILPEMQNLSNKQIEFYARNYTGTSTFKIGIMTDPTNASSFTQIGESITPTSSYQKYIVSFENYTGAGTYIAFNMDAANSTTSTRSVCIDNIAVMPLPDCATPTGLAVTANSQTPEGATITWAAGEGTAWTVEYKKSTEEDWTTVTPNVTEATYTFTGLDYSTTYNARVSVACTGVTYPTDPVNFTTKVQFPAPTNLVTSNLTHESVTLAWTAGYTNQTAWKIEYKKNADAWTAATTEAVSNPTINIPGLVENTTYNVRIYGGQGENFGTDYLSGNFTTKYTCSAPTNLVISSITSQSATLSWTPGYQETSWTVKYKSSTVTAWDDPAVVTVENATNPITINSLTGATTYNVRVYNCTDVDPLTGNFSTAYSVPFIEEFSTTSTPTNWENKIGLLDNVMTGTALTSSSQWSFGTHSNLFNSHARINIYGGIAESNARYGWLITPNITVGNNYSLSFDLALTNYDTPTGMTQPVTPQTTGTDDKFIVLVSTDNEANWTVLRQWDNAGSAYVYNDIAYNGETVYIDLAAYNNQTVRLAFYGESTVKNADNNLHIDNVEINITSDCHKPQNVTASNETNHSATITWVAGTVGQELWQLKYNKDADFDPNTEGTAVVVETNPTYTFNKTLDAESMYYIYVRGNCGITTDPDYGPWSKKCIVSTGTSNPAPTAFNKKEVGPDWVDLYWTAPAGDYLSGYGIYYQDAATPAPTAETLATVTIDNPTAPTSENPYRLTNLDNEHTYYIWVRANHETNVYSAWTQLAYPYYITTLVACPAPIDVEIDETTLTHTTADLSWTGYSDSYTVQKRTAAHANTTYLDEDFEEGEMPTGWTAATQWTVSEGSYMTLSTAYEGNYNAMCSHSSTGSDYYLITPSMDLSGASDIKLNFFYANPYYSDYYDDDIDGFGVYYRVNEGDWTELFYTTDLHNAWTEKEITLSGLSANYQIGFKMHDNYGGGVAIDKVVIAEFANAGDWENVATNVTETPYPLTGLTAGTKYDVRVKGNCEGGEYSNVHSFTTIDANTKVFTTEGNWDDATNWMDEMVANDLTDDVILQNNVIIPSGYTVLANSITRTDNTLSLTVKDGGQLICNNQVSATMEKSIDGYTIGTAAVNGQTNGWYFIASPLIDDVDPFNTAMLDHNYDLFQLNPTENLWENHKEGNVNSGFNLTNGRGYLFASSEHIDIQFTGDVKPYTMAEEVDVLEGWNLIGNPFTYEVYANQNYYKMNEDQTNFVAVEDIHSETIMPCTGVLVEAEEDGTVTFSKEAQVSSVNHGNIQLALAQTVATRDGNNMKTIDNAIVSFNEGSKLSKFYFGQQNANIYIPQDNKELAIVSAEAQGEMPVCFQAYQDGQYTITVNTNDVEMAYLHLIDNLAGKDVDLIANPSYTFDAIVSEYPSRFRLVFNANMIANDSDSENFAFMSNGSLIIANEGEATLQVIDVNGRILSSETINGSFRKTFNAKTGVYVLRLINGNEVKTQKLIVK